jgi:hypothetical protein
MKRDQRYFKRVTITVTLTTYSPTTDHCRVIVTSQVDDNLAKKDYDDDVFFPCDGAQLAESAELLGMLMLEATQILDPAELRTGAVALPHVSPGYPSPD